LPKAKQTTNMNTEQIKCLRLKAADLNNNAIRLFDLDRTDESLKAFKEAFETLYASIQDCSLEDDGHNETCSQEGNEKVIKTIVISSNLCRPISLILENDLLSVNTLKLSFSAILHNIALVQFQKGSYDVAQNLLQMSLMSIQRNLCQNTKKEVCPGAIFLVMSLHFNLGRTSYELNSNTIEVSIECFLDALEMGKELVTQSTELNHRMLLPQVLVELGQVLLQEQMIAEAVETFRQASTLYFPGISLENKFAEAAAAA